MADRVEPVGAAATGRSLSDPWRRAPAEAGGVALPAPVRRTAAWLVGSVGIAAQVVRETGSRANGVAVVAVAAVTILAVTAFVGAWSRRAPGVRAGAVIGVVVAFVGGLAAARTTTGGRQFLLVVVATALALLALGAPNGRSARTARPPAAIAIGPLVAAQLSWYRLAPQWVTAALVAAAGALVTLAVARPGAAASLERRIVSATQRVMTLVGALVLFPVALLTLYLPGLVLRLARSAKKRPRADSGSWSPVRIDPAEQRRDARRPFASTDPTVRRRRVRVGSVATAAAAVALVATVVAVRDRDPSTVAVGTGNPDAAAAPHGNERRFFAVEGAGIRYSDLPAYRGVPWADDLQAAQSTDDVRSPMFNVSGGDRRTIDPPQCACRRLTVWFDGGSAAFGIGQRDEHTIASNLVTLAAADDIALHVVNISRAGSVSATDVDRVTARLDTTPPPDLVIYYNGWNDVLSHVLNRFAQSPEGRIPAGRDPSLVMENANDHTDTFLASDTGADAGRDALQDLRFMLARADDIDRSAGTSSVFFLQPDATVDRSQLAGYDTISNVSADEVLSSPLADALTTVDQGLDRRIVNLRSDLAAVTEPTFLGLVHQNETGALLVARAMYAQLRDRFDDLAR